MVRKPHIWNTSARNIIGAATSILVLRIIYYLLFNPQLDNSTTLLGEITEIIGNTWALLTLLIGNVIVAMRIPNSILSTDNRYPMLRKLGVSVITLSLIAATITLFNLPTLDRPSFHILPFIRTLSAALIVDIITITIYSLVRLSTISQQELREEREQKHRSEYQYERLKQQLNPHFLFNS